MRHGRTFRKRCLTFLLSLAMVLTSVNVPMLTVWAEEATDEDGNDAGILPVDNDGDEATDPSDEGGEEPASLDNGDDDVTPPEGDESLTTTPVGDENQVGETAAVAETTDSVPAQPFGLVVEHWTGEDAHKGMIRVVWGAPNPIDATSWEMYLDGTLVNTVTSVGEYFLENKSYELGMHKFDLYAVNAAGKSTVCTVDFEIKNIGGGNQSGEGGEGEEGGDEPEAKIPATPQGLEARYSTDSGYEGKIWVVWNSVFGDGGTPTSWEVYIDKILVGTETRVAAYYYDNTYEEGKHTVELYAVNKAGKCATPAKWEFTLTAEQAGSSDTVATAEDKQELQTLYDAEKANVDKGQQNYTSATWNPYVEAVEQAKTVLDDEEATVKEVNDAVKALKLAKQNLKVKEDETVTILISEQQAQAVVGSDVTLSYRADAPDFAFGDDYTMTINGAVADTSKVTIHDSSIVIPSELFASEGNYKIQLAKSGCVISPVYQKVYANKDKDDWNLVWHDEFDGTSLDMTKWDYQTGNGSAYGTYGWGNSEAQIYTDSNENTSVGDGKLTITGKKEADGSYTSARLRTVTEEIGADGKAAVGTPLQIGTYGKVESKIKLPAGNGIWPAFWMLPHDSEYGTWAASGEIDIMEARGRLPGEVCGTIHYGNVWPNNSSAGKTHYFDEGDSIEQYHLYTFEWDPTEMRWYVDGKLYSTINNWFSVQSDSGNYPYPAPFDEEFYVLLNLALGGTFDSGTTEIAVDENGVNMDVDYVRWYQRTGGYEDWDLTEPDAPKDESTDATTLLAMADANGNYIKDGDFSEMSTTPYTTDGSWKIERGYWAPLLIPTNGNGSATWSKVQNGDKNYLKVAVTNVGSQTYSSQMLQYFPVVKGYSYEISYSAYTDAANQKADVSLKIGGDGDNGWAVYSGNYSDKLTTTPTTYTHKFAMTADTDPTARFEFNLATSAGNVYLSDVCVKIIDGISEDEGEDEDKEPLADGNHVYNGTFSNGSDSLLYWHWGTADEKEKVSVVREDKERKAKINASAGSPVSLWQYGMNMLQKDDYVLTFDVKSDAAQHIVLSVTNKDGTESYADATMNVAAGESTVEWTFTQPEGKTDTSGKLMLTFNGAATIDNVKLVRTTFNNVDYDKVDLYPLANGDFSNGVTGWNIWHEGAGWETHKVNDQGQLELNDVVIGDDATFYCVGIKSPSMTLTKGVNYKVQFDYVLPEEKTYTLELGGIQREITLEAGTHTYESEPFAGSGSGEFALYLGPNKASNYTFILDNVVVAAQLPEKEGYWKPVSMVQNGKAKLGSDVVVTYAGETADREAAWGSAEKTYYLNGEEIDASKVSVDTAKKTITLDASLFAEDGEFTFSVKAEGFIETKTISLSILSADGNLLVNGNFSSGTAGWTFYKADWEGGAGGSFEVNDDGVAVINHIWDSGESWHFQLNQNVKYDAGDYIVIFDAWADVERPIRVQMLPASGQVALVGASSYANLSKEKKTYKVMWKGMAAGTDTTFLNFEMGSMTNDGLTAPNDGNNPYNIYLDNIVFRPLTADDENATPATIASAGAGKAGTDDVTITCTDANEKWQNAAKTVYVNDEAVSADKVTDNKTSLVIDPSVFAEAGRYSIYVVAEGFEETNKVFKNMIGADGNLIFGGDMSDASQWVVYDEDADNLSKGKIARGIYTLDYKAGYYRNDWNCWVTWSSQLKKENISVVAGTKYVLRFEAATDLAGGRDIIIEFGTNTNQTTATVKEGGLGVYEVEITPSATADDCYITFILGPVGEKLQVDGEVPHTMKIDNVTLRTAAEDATAAKAELDASIAEYEKLTQGEYTDESWAAFTAALVAAKAVAAKTDATTTEITTALNDLKRAAEKLTGPTDKTELQTLLEQYKDVEGDAAFKAAYAQAQEIAADPAATQTEIENAVKALREAYQNLPQSADKTALNALIAQYVAVTDGGYTAESWKTFTDALAAAQKIAAKADATQAEVDSAKETLETAYTGLRYEYHEGLWIAPIAAQTYTGAAIKPEIEVYNNGTLLELKKDYTVTYKNNTNAGTATVTVKGKGNFKGSDTAEFTINKKNIGDEDVTVADVFAIISSKGKVTNPKPVVKFGKKTLKVNNDYRVSYPELETVKDEAGKDQIVAKDYTITIETTAVKQDKKTKEYLDSANYTGSTTITYTVRSSDTKLMSKAKVTLEKTKVDYANDEAGNLGQGTEKPKVKSVKIGSTTLTEDVDFIVSYDDWDKAGKATVTVTAKEGTAYYGSKSVTYTVNGTKLAAKELEIKNIESSYEYTGQEICAAAKNGDPMTVTRVKGVTEPVLLKEGTDYTISYKTGKKLGEHTNAGTVTVTITGANAYTGSVSKTFKITPVDLTLFGTENAPAGLKFTPAASAKHTKTGAQLAIDELSFNGAPLLVKQDYTVSYTKNKAATTTATAVMTIKGKGNFKGKITQNFIVDKASVADVAITTTDIEAPAKFNKLKTTVKVVEESTGKALKAGTDYDKTIKYYKDAGCADESQITSANFSEWIEGVKTNLPATVYTKVVMKNNYGDGSEVVSFRLYDSGNKITNAKKYKIELVKTETATGETIACDNKKNPLYTGYEIKPKVVITPVGTDTTPLTLDKDYVVSYSNNTNKGKATVTVTAIGTYGGTKDLKFSIVSADMKWYEATAQKIATFFSNLF